MRSTIDFTVSSADSYFWTVREHLYQAMELALVQLLKNACNQKRILLMVKNPITYGCILSLMLSP